MQANRKTLAANAETEFEFDEFETSSVVVKNETPGEILFCDGPFDATTAAHIPAYSWQSLKVKVHPDRVPSFYIKATVAGAVEVDFGSSGMGTLFGPAFNAAGMIPHTLTFGADDDTTLLASLVRKHGETLDLDTPVSLTTGATVYAGDVIQFTAASTDTDCDPALTANGLEVELTQGVARYTIAGDADVQVVAVPIEYTLTLTVGADTTLTAALIRERGAAEDLATPVPLATGAKVNADDIVRFTAAATEESFHATLTVNESPQVLTDGVASYTIAGNTTAVTAAAAD